MLRMDLTLWKPQGYSKGHVCMEREGMGSTQKCTSVL